MNLLPFLQPTCDERGQLGRDRSSLCATQSRNTSPTEGASEIWLIVSYVVTVLGFCFAF